LRFLSAQSQQRRHEKEVDVLVRRHEKEVDVLVRHRDILLNALQEEKERADMEW